MISHISEEDIVPLNESGISMILRMFFSFCLDFLSGVA